MKLASWLSELRSAPARRRSSPAPRIASAAAVESLETRVLLSATTRELFFSVSSAPATTLPGAGAVGGSDIVRYDGTDFTVFFDGSDVGLDAADIRGFAFKSETELLLSFAGPVDIEGVGTVQPWQVVLFTATSLGEETAGQFSLFFDAHSHGLGSGANGRSTFIDALELLDDGSLLISTEGSVIATNSATGQQVAASDTDVLRFAFPPPNTGLSGEWSLHFKGANVGLEAASEDIDGLAVAADGNHFFSTFGSFFLGGPGGDNQDVMEFVPTSLGAQTSGSFILPLFFDGSAVGLAGRNVDAIAIGRPLTTNNPPVADSQQATTDEDLALDLQLTGDDGDPGVEQGLRFEIISGPAHGTLGDFDPATGLLQYTPHANFAGADSFTFVVYEVNADGSIGLVSEHASVSITVNAVNDAPTHTVPGDRVGNEDVPLVIRGIAVHDVDAGDGAVQVSLSVASGTLTIDPAVLGGGTASGNGSGTVVLTGSLDEINAVLARGVTYVGHPDFNGRDSLVVFTSDLGNSGAGGALTARSEVAIHVRSPQEQAQGLADSLDELVDAGLLSDSTAGALANKLEFKNPVSAEGRVGAFMNQVNALVRSGRLGAEDAQALLEAAETLIQSLETTAPQPRGKNGMAAALDQAFVEYDAIAEQIGASKSKKKT
jgi:hypothetical protein